MELNEFIKNFVDQFDDADVSEINANTDFHDLDEWSSLTSMSIIAMVRTTYGKKISGQDIRKCQTVGNLYELVSKL